MSFISLRFAHIEHYLKLMRVDKPIGTLLLLWPTFWALWLASNGLPDWHFIIVFSAGVFIMRSAGCVINDFADRKVDGQVKRTKDRPLAAGLVTTKETLQLFALLIITAFLLVLTLNYQTILLSFVALLLAFSYPFMKRYTHLPQVVLGAAFSWSIPMAYMAVGQSVPVEAWMLYGANLLWTVAYDTMYGMVDRDDDIKIGVKSTAILFGRADKLIIAVLQISSLLLISYLMWQQQMATWLIMLNAGVVSIFFMYQQWLIKNHDRNNCFKAFLNNNYVGLVTFMAIALGLSIG